MAKARNREPAMWAFMCFFTGFVGLLVLLAIGENQSTKAGGEQSDTVLRLGANQPPNGVIHSFDRNKWSALKDVDPEISEAAQKIFSYGPRYEEEFAARYLAINDKNYLESIVRYVEKQWNENEEKIAFEAEEKLKRSERTLTSFEDFSSSSKYKRQLDALKESNFFEISDGIVIILPDFRCVQIGNMGDIAVYPGLLEREAENRRDKKWVYLNGEKKLYYIESLSHALIKDLYLKDALVV